MGFGWEGERVRLVPLDKQKHLENAVVWLNDPDVTEWTLVGDFPLSRLAEEEYFERAMRETDQEIHFAVETREGEHIGFAGIHRIDWRHGTAVTGIVIGPKEVRGQGWGTDAMRVRTRYAFEVLGLRLLMAEVMAGNARCLKAAQKAGYREVGRIPRRYWKRGAWRDDVVLVIEGDSWEGEA
jgi:RimJ/RimL family protein N-acetyltransferase